MQKGTAIRKIPGGKLIRVDVGYQDSVEQVKITGDFFLFPDETLEQIEALLLGAKLPLDDAALVQRIEELLRVNQAELMGLSPADIIATLEEALQ